MTGTSSSTKDNSTNRSPNEQQEPLLRTKLFLPRIRANRFDRSLLIEKLNLGLDKKVILVSAPAGFGKTTLIADWVSQCTLPVGWVSLDTEDNNPSIFLSYLISALEGVLHDLRTSTSLMIKSPQPLPPQAILSTLLNDLSELSRSFIVVLDDYQFIKTSHVNKLISYLLDHQPDQLHLVIASREDPSLPLARLRGADQLVEIRTDDLRLTQQEAGDFLTRVMGLELTEADIKVLNSRTEGWIAGLQMAGLSLQGRRDTPGFIRSFGGSNRFILEYLVEEVLDCQSKDTRSFLLHTSCLERFCAPLCEVVTGQYVNTQEKLEKLERANLFLVPLDDEHHWYRYHHLFADLLQAQLIQSEGSQEVSALHIRATDWFEHNGMIQEAINHALLANDFERAARLIEENYLAMVSRGDMASLDFWAGKLPREYIYRRPRLCIHEAHSHTWSGHLDEASLLCQEAEKGIRSKGSTLDTQPLLGHLSYVQSRITAMRGDTQRAIELCLQARKNTPASHIDLQAAIGITLGYIYFLAGDFTKAQKILSEITQPGYAASAINPAIAAWCVLARMYVILGQLHKAYDLLQEAAQWLKQTGEQRLGAIAVVEIGISDLLCEMNDLEAASDHMMRGLDLMHVWGKADDLALAYITLMRIQQAQGNMPAVVETGQKAIQLIKTCGVFSEARNAVEAAKIRLWLEQSDLPSAIRWADSYKNKNESDDSFRFENELVQITLARVLSLKGELKLALELLVHLTENAQTFGRNGRLIEILCLKALILKDIGENRAAVSALITSLTLAEPEGYMRIFLDEGIRMKSLIQFFLLDAKDEEIPKHLIAYANRLMSAFSISDSQTRSKTDDLQTSLVNPLSARELEILNLICDGYSNQQIAEKLVISLNTVKRHNNNIFNKLGVANRSQAIVRVLHSERSLDRSQ